MITSNNITEFFDMLTKEQIDETLKSGAGYCVLKLSVFNTGAFAYLRPTDADHEEREEVESAGGIICDKEDLLRLFKESNSKNEHFDNWL